MSVIWVTFGVVRVIVRCHNCCKILICFLRYSPADDLHAALFGGREPPASAAIFRNSRRFSLISTWIARADVWSF
jgi:hypothetical protein